MKTTTMIGVSALALLAAGLGYWAHDLAHDHGTGLRAGAVHAEGEGHEHGAGEADDHGTEEGAGDGHEHEHGHDGEDGAIPLSAAQIARAGIQIMAAGSGDVSREIRVTGTIVPDADGMADVASRVAGVVATVDRQLGDRVATGDVLAVLDSRDLAEAKADYLAARREEALASTTLKREEDLWRRKISAEQDYLDARTAAETSRIRLDAARQRLVSLGLSATAIEALPAEGRQSLGRLEIRSPIAGRIIARTAVRGELVAADRTVFTIADLSVVWVDLPVYAQDLPLVREGQTVTVQGADGRSAQGRVIFAGPTLDPQTGAARVVASLENADGAWRPGDFAAGTIATGDAIAALAVPATAVQTMNGQTVVFVRTDEGFVPRAVVVGRRNASTVEVLSGLMPGEPVASGNSFLLKAEASKGAAEHSHTH